MWLRDDDDDDDDDITLLIKDVAGGCGVAHTVQERSAAVVSAERLKLQNVSSRRQFQHDPSVSQRYIYIFIHQTGSSRLHSVWKK